MSVLYSCFGCCSLRTGCIIIALFILFIQLCGLAITGTSVLLLIGVPLAPLLLVGAFWRNRISLWFWIVLNSIWAVLLCVALVLDLLFTSVKTKAHDPSVRRIDFKTTYAVFCVVFFIAIVTSLIIFTVVVYSYICELRVRNGKNGKDGNDAPPPEAKNLVQISEFSVAFEKKIDEMFNSK